MRWHTAHNARNWLAHVLGRRDNQTACQQQYRCEYIMQPKNGIVDLDFLPFEIILQSTE